jgi:hypothetical protein
VQDHARAVAGGGARRQERGPRADLDRTEDIVHRHVDQRRALHVAARDQVERDVDLPDGGGVRVDRLLVGGVEHGDVPAGVRGHGLERFARAADEVNGRALAGERARHGGTDIATGAIDHCGLASQKVGHAQ